MNGHYGAVEDDKYYSLYIQYSNGEIRKYLKDDGSVWIGTGKEALDLRWKLAQGPMMIAHSLMEEDAPNQEKEQTWEEVLHDVMFAIHNMKEDK